MYAYLNEVMITPPAVAIPAAFHCVYVTRRYCVGDRSEGLLYGGVLPAEGGFVQDKAKELRGTMHSFIDAVVEEITIFDGREQVDVATRRH